MTTSDDHSTAFVWIWLPGATQPVIAGRLESNGDIVTFVYGRSYLERDDAIALYVPELPLRRGEQQPLDGMKIAGVIADSGPDAWGQRVIIRKLAGASAVANTDPDSVNPLTYLLMSGSDRIGALDFQSSSSTYVARTATGTLDELHRAAERLEAGEPFSPELDAALLHGSSLGGARPKVLLDDGSRKLIAKFARQSDPYPVVKAEGVAMGLAARVGLNVAPTQVIESLGHDVLLVDRFDRTAVPGERRLVVSALTILQLDERWGRHATYHELADVVRTRFSEPAATLRELFARIAFNICVGNTDDHARNHAAFWDGRSLTLTPAYDICPQTRSGGEAVQAMAFRPDGYKFSHLEGLVAGAPTYLLDALDAREIVEHQVEVINTDWDDACDAARLTVADRRALWHRQILNPYCQQPDD